MMMTRFLYTLAIHALLPWAILHLFWRARRQPEYLRHWGERFGRYRPRPPEPTLWIHAVSVGETRAAQPLVAALRARHPGHRILLTHMTPTGRAASRALFGDQVERVYLPYDTPWAASAFLRHFKPDLGIIMETELWPNLVAACRDSAIPLLLVNARLSEKSARRYARFPDLTRTALRQLSALAASGADDARRLRQLGAPEVAVFGNLKFDIEPAAECVGALEDHDVGDAAAAERDRHRHAREAAADDQDAGGAGSGRRGGHRAGRSPAATAVTAEGTEGTENGGERRLRRQLRRLRRLRRL